MGRCHGVLGLAASLVMLLIAQSGVLLSPVSAMQPSDPPVLRQAKPFETMAGFVANHGQWEDEVLFFARHQGVTATLTREAIVWHPQRDPESGDPALPPVVMRLPRSVETVVGIDSHPVPHHFLLGSGKASHVPGFERVVYRDVAPGLDIVLRRETAGFAYDLHADAGVDLSTLVLEFDGVDSASMLDGARLSMGTLAGNLEQRIGASWEVAGDGSVLRTVSSHFRLLSAGPTVRIGFDAPERDLGRPFVLDPSLVWATYLGGASQERVYDMHVAPSGEVYLAVKAYGVMPTTPGAFEGTPPGGSNAWVGKLSADGASLLWGTFLGGSLTEDVVGLEVDGDGTVVVLGDTWSADFPTTRDSVQPDFAGMNDMFLCRLTADGSDLLWSTFYGGAEFDHATSLALFGSGEPLISGYTDTPEPLATPGALDISFDDNDNMLARFSADGEAVVFHTYFGSGAFKVAIKDDAAIYLAGNSGGNLGGGIVTTPGAFKQVQAPLDPLEAFVAKIDPMGTELHWATLLGGDEGTDLIKGLCVDAAGAVYVVGNTTSPDFPTTDDAFDITLASDGDDNFVVKLLPDGTGLVWSSYFGACCGGVTILWDIVVDTAGCALVIGSSNEPGLPTTADAFQPDFLGAGFASDVHLTKFDAFGESLHYSTYFGGTIADSGNAFVDLTADQHPVAAFKSNSVDVPTTQGAYDGSFNGGTADVFVAKFELPVSPWTVLTGGMSGSVDVPNLAGGGALTPGSQGRLAVRAALPDAVAFIVAGASSIYHPLEGGVLVPAPTLVAPVLMDGDGAFDVSFVWLSLGAGIDLWVQVWVVDPGGVYGYAATNALRMTAQ